MTAGKTVPELTPATPPIVGTDELVVYRAPGPLTRTTATIFADYIKAFYSASGGSALVGFIGGLTGATARTAQAKMRDTVSVKDFGAVGDGTTNDSPAFDLAVAALPASGGVVLVPDATGYKLNTSISTGTKKVAWRVGQTTITCPAGEHGFLLQSNGSSFEGAGKWATILKLTAPVSAMVLPTITASLTGGAVSSVSIGGGGSGMRSCPVAVLTNSPSAGTTNTPDAGLVLTQSGGTVSLASIVAAGSGYVSAPTVTLLGGAQAAVMIDNVQSCTVKGFSVDFSSVPGSVGVYHRGGWWVHVEDVDVIYNTTSGVTTESSTSIGLMIDSYTLGAPGPTGGYGGTYVSQYTNIHFTRRAMVGHDTSTVTTLNFNRCDFKNSYLHACIDIVDLGPVAQADSGYFYDLINVDGLTIIGGDFESTAGWFHFIGSSNNIRAIGTLTVSASGARYRGQPGPGSYFDFAMSTSTIEPLRFGSGGGAGNAYQNTGWNIKHRYGISYSGDTWTVGASNIKPTAALTGNLDDTSASGMWLTTSTGGEFRGCLAYAGTNPVTGFQMFKIDASGYFVGTTKVVGAQGAAVADATDAASVIARLNDLLARLRTHGLIAT